LAEYEEYRYIFILRDLLYATVLILSEMYS